MILRSDFINLSKRISPIAWALFFGYILLLLYFYFVDFYHHHFFTKGLLIFNYNVARFFFMFYLMWLFYAAGDLFFALFFGNSYRNKMTLDYALLAFVSGVGLWHVLLLFIGFAGLYSRPLMDAITLLLFVFSLRKLNQWIHLCKISSATYWPGWAIVLVPLFFFLITKGLYPAGGHDYYNHYFPYYREVIRTGTILPNEVWYHFYYSKGDGLFFMSMLITDPLAPQLATAALIIAGAAMIFNILKASSSNHFRLLPWIGAGLYIAFLIYTPGPLRQIGWADLEKAHEPASVLILAMIWITYNFAQTFEVRKWGTALLLSMTALVIINPFVAPYACIYLFLAALIFYLSNKKQAAQWLLSGSFVAAAWLLFLAIVNFYLTGVPDEQKLMLYLPFIDFQKVDEWGVVMEMLKFLWDRNGMMLSKVPLFSGHFLHVYFTYIRLDVWGPLLLFACLVWMINYCFRPWRGAMLKAMDKTALATTGGFLILVLVVSLFIGRDQHTSYYRFTIFSYAPMLCFCLLLLSSGLQKTKFAMLFLIIGFIGAWLVLRPFMHYETDKIFQVLVNGTRFATGQYSLADGYRNQQGWPGRKPWGGIYPGALKAWAQLPPNTRIWSMHENSYCMLPDCRMETYPSYRLSKHSRLIFYGGPKAAKECLKKEGLNYFFFSHSLSLTDPIPLAPLFSPREIAKYLGILWTDGNDTLLTWKEQSQYPIDAAWLLKYKQSIDVSRIIQSFPYEHIQLVLNALKKKPRLGNADIPWYHAG
jgi:hypothetical protein